MANETKYGIISDVHQNLKIVPAAIEILKSLGAKRLLINGDIGNHQPTLQESQDFVAFILDAVGKSGLESFVQPGSHESLLAYLPVIEHFAGKYSNLVNVLKNQKAEMDGHYLAFLPGSDFTCGGEFQIGNNDQIPSGRYIQTQEGLIQFEELGQYIRALQRGIAQGVFQYANMLDLKKLVTHPDKTIVVCHVPRRFNNIETCIDFAEFGEVVEDFFLQGNEVKKGSIFPIQVAPRIIQAGHPVVLKKENGGSMDLKGLYEELGIKKSVTGHFHESSHRANDLSGCHVEQGRMVGELFWNSGCLDMGHAGLLIVDGEKVQYENIRIQDYLRYAA